MSTCTRFDYITLLDSYCFQLEKEESMTQPIRTKEIKVRLTEDEHQALLDRMEGNQLATWIRKTALSQKIAKPYKNADPKLLGSLGRIGGNLNQIAKQANTLDKDTDKLRVFAQLTVIREQLNEVLDRHDR